MLADITAPNLDAATAEELEQAGRVFDLYASYCRWKRHAIRHRLAGNVERALRCEQQADTAYAKLPAWAQW